MTDRYKADDGEIDYGHGDDDDDDDENYNYHCLISLSYCILGVMVSS